MKVIMAGESWIVAETHMKGFDTAVLNRYEDFFADRFFEVLKDTGVELDYYPNHIAQSKFPQKAEELTQYDAVIISDCGSNTLLLDPEMQFKGVRKGNRLLAIQDYVKAGGGLLMCGGYLSFAGLENKARYAMTPIADVLPVDMLNWDDRMEHPEGVTPVVTKADHPVLKGIDNSAWPEFLGYNKIMAKDEADEIATIDGDTFMAAWDYGQGRAFAFASDLAPHWGTKEFLDWEGYEILFTNILKWLAKEI
ncbi:MAG: cytoplasmic protein [Anaerolineaceae bacterium]|nr:cytoplasmic protein [Anaerolineaceae bacterium]